MPCWSCSKKPDELRPSENAFLWNTKSRNHELQFTTCNAFTRAFYGTLYSMGSLLKCPNEFRRWAPETDTEASMGTRRAMLTLLKNITEKRCKFQSRPQSLNYVIKLIWWRFRRTSVGFSSQRCNVEIFCSNLVRLVLFFEEHCLIKQVKWVAVHWEWKPSAIISLKIRLGPALLVAMVWKFLK